MNKGLEHYKAFIDGLVERKDSVQADWILGKGYPQTDDNKKINQFLDKLTSEQKAVLADMVSQARYGGIHDTLAYINEMMDCNGLVLSQGDERYPYDYFDCMHYDFVCRSEGDDWPE